MNAKLYALAALVAMAALPVNSSALKVNTTCPFDNLDGLTDETALASLDNQTDFIAESGAYALKCGGGGGGGGSEPMDPPGDIAEDWVEFARGILNDGIGEPGPEPDPYPGDLPDLDGITANCQPPVYTNCGGATSSCHFTNTVCAMAGADSHLEYVGSLPELAVMLTMGGGQSNTPLGGSAQVSTSLGSGTCQFPGNGGCMLNWSDLKHAENCNPTWAIATARSTFTATAKSVDAICERR